MTYSSPEVVRLLNSLFVPVRIDAGKETGLADFYEVIMTPTFVATDSQEKAHYRAAGFLPPEEFLPQVKLMRAVVHLNQREYPDAIRLLSDIIGQSFSSAATPEALYWLGVSRYRSSGDFNEGIQEWRKLKMHFPESPWLKKVGHAL